MSAAPEPILSCRAIHELSSDDYRILDFERDSVGLRSLRSVRFANGAANYASVDCNEATLLHIPEHYYLYGTTYAPDGAESHIYDDFARNECHDYALLHTNPLTDNHTSWCAVPGDQMARRHKIHGQDVVISSGLTGVHRVAGIDHHSTYLWVSLERHDSVVAIVQGSHVLFHMTVPIGTSNLIRSLAEMMKSDTGFARNVLEKYGFMHTHHDSRVRDVLLHVVSPVVSAIQNTINALHSMPYRKSFERQPISTWLFGGAGANIPGLAEYFSLFIDMPPWDAISDEYRRVIQTSKTPINRETIPRYYMVLGLTSVE